MTSIHIRLENEEALSIKKDILNFEKGLLETIKKVRDYNNLRKKEFALKSQIKKDLSSLKELIFALEPFLPTEDIGQIDKKKGKQQEIRIKIKKSPAKDSKRKEIEREIREIQGKLSLLE